MKYHVRVVEDGPALCGAHAGEVRMLWDIIPGADTNRVPSNAELDRVIAEVCDRCGREMARRQRDLQSFHLTGTKNGRAVCGRTTGPVRVLWVIPVAHLVLACVPCRRVFARAAEVIHRKGNFLPQFDLVEKLLDDDKVREWVRRNGDGQRVFEAKADLPASPILPPADLPPREAYSACLRMLAEVVHRAQDPLRQALWLTMQGQARGRDGGRDAIVMRLLAEVLEKVHPVFWSRDIPIPPFRGTDEPMLQETIRQRPGDPVLNDAFIYFEEPVVIPGYSSWDLTTQTDVRVRAIAVGIAPPHLVGNYADLVMAFSDLTQVGNAIPLTVSLQLGERDRLRPPAWYNGTVDETNGGVQRYLWRLAYHCMTFMSQRVDVSRDRGPASRPVRKEAQRILRRTPPEVVIVHYRRPAAPVERSEPTGRTLSVQFDVDGFWRNQRVGPGRKEIRRTWVAGFHKGPPDAPWSRPPVTIAAVVR